MANVKRKDIGALWKRKSKKDGQTFLYGKIEVNGQTVEFRAYKNDYKKDGDKTPDLRIFPVVPSANQTAPAVAAEPAKKAAAPVVTPTEDPLV